MYAVLTVLMKVIKYILLQSGIHKQHNCSIVLEAFVHHLLHFSCVQVQHFPCSCNLKAKAEVDNHVTDRVCKLRCALVLH